jgi:ATP-binding cassette, subfamily B (MDR/TAP), member 1
MHEKADKQDEERQT